MYYIFTQHQIHYLFTVLLAFFIVSVILLCFKGKLSADVLSLTFGGRPRFFKTPLDEGKLEDIVSTTLKPLTKAFKPILSFS